MTSGRARTGIGIAVVVVLLGLLAAVALDGGDAGDAEAYCAALDRRVEPAMREREEADQVDGDADEIDRAVIESYLDEARVLDTLSAHGPVPGGVHAEVFLVLEEAGQLDAVARRLADIDGIRVVATRDQAAALERFTELYGDEDGSVSDAILPTDLPPSVLVAGDADAVATLVIAVKDDPEVETVLDRRQQWAEFAAVLVASAAVEDLDQLVSDAPDGIRSTVEILTDANRDLPPPRVPLEPLATDPELARAAETLVADAAERCGLAPLAPL